MKGPGGFAFVRLTIGCQYGGFSDERSGEQDHTQTWGFGPFALLVLLSLHAHFWMLEFGPQALGL